MKNSLKSRKLIVPLTLILILLIGYFGYSLISQSYEEPVEGTIGKEIETQKEIKEPTGPAEDNLKNTALRDAKVDETLGQIN